MQLRLIPSEPPLLPFDDPGTATGETASEPAPSAGQIPLFTGPLQAVGDVEVALDQADPDGLFLSLRALRETYGEHAVPSELRRLDLSGFLPGSWWCSASPDERLRAWRSVDRQLAGRRRERFRRGFFLRLLAEAGTTAVAAAVAAADPEALPALHAVLQESGEHNRARELVRDALAAGTTLDGAAFAHDADVASLLANDRNPRWLAAEGVVEQLWRPPPPPGPAALAGFAHEIAAPAPSGEAGRAASFWRCLAVAHAAGRAPGVLVEAARKRMKELEPDLHRAYLDLIS